MLPYICHYPNIPAQMASVSDFLKGKCCAFSLYAGTEDVNHDLDHISRSVTKRRCFLHNTVSFVLYVSFESMSSWDVCCLGIMSALFCVTCNVCPQRIIQHCFLL